MNIMAKQHENKNMEAPKASKMAFGLAGAVAGAAIGTAAAMALSNRRTREKFVDTVTDLGKEAVGMAKEMNAMENGAQNKKS